MDALARQGETPLFDAVAGYAGQGIIRFHMPGHKGGGGVHRRLLDFLGEGTFRLDVTGVMGLDDLHEPSGIIRRAQELAAEAFGGDHSFFLVNGTTAGLHAMILATCAPGDKIIVARNMHKSALAGVILSGAHPVYVKPETDLSIGLAMGVTPEAVEEALEAHPDARAVLLVSPTYYGVTSDLQSIAEAVRARGIPLLVDEAHGPHFRFHEELPLPALEAGADACAHGMHKILGGMTQASILHVREGRIDVPRLKRVLGLIQTTSASYVLMASLDVARMQMATRGRELIGRAIDLAGRLRSGVRAIPGLTSFGRENLGRPGFFGLDPTKVTVCVKDIGLSGQEAEAFLRERHGIQVELSDLFNVLFIVGFGNTDEEIARLIAALDDLVECAPLERRSRTVELLEAAGRFGPLPSVPPLAAYPREAFDRPSVATPLDRAVGGICAELVTCYPPGIPIICPGERVTPEVRDYLTVIRQFGLRISGPSDPTLETLRLI